MFRHEVLVTAPTPITSRIAKIAIENKLITQAQLDGAWAALRAAPESPREGPQPSDVPGQDDPSRLEEERLAAKLVELGHINRWQADQLLGGQVRFLLGPYRILDTLGQGGMGQVFKAEHTLMRRIVAIKVLPRHRSTPENIERFRREVQAQAQLDHPNLVRAFDAGQEGNVHFMVTEFVPGLDLRRLIKAHGPLGMPAAAAVVCQAAKGLEHAHSRGLIHRDVKPGNILVTPEGVCKLSDLGLAGFLNNNEAESEETEEQRAKTVGTADYLSPEQILTPEKLTPACDIYALGCTLYYTVTGKVPFPGGSTRDKARRHCHEQPVDPRRLIPELEMAFVDVMADMMMKEPDQRIATAAEVTPRLRPWAGDDWPATVMSGATRVEAAAGAAPPPLPSSGKPLRLSAGGGESPPRGDAAERGDSRAQWSQGTAWLGSPSEETMPLDSQAGFPPQQVEEGLPGVVLIVIWLAVAAAMAVFGMILYRSLF